MNSTSKAREIQDYSPILQICHIMELTGFSECTAYEFIRYSNCSKVKIGKRIVVLRDPFWEWLAARS